jgi:hypothetical protein
LRPEDGVFERFTTSSRQVIAHAQSEATRLRHAYIGTEHLVLGLLHVDGIAARALAGRGVTAERVRASVVRIVGMGGEPVSGQLPMTPRAKQALYLAVGRASALGVPMARTEHLLVGIADEGDGVGMSILRELGTDPDAIRADVARAIGVEELPAPIRANRVWRRTWWSWSVRRLRPGGWTSRGHTHPRHRRRAIMAIAVALAAPLAAWLWQIASVSVNRHLPNTCNPPLQVRPAGGWMVPAVLSMAPIVALLIVPRTRWALNRTALVLSVLSAMFFTFFWLQLIGLVHCQPSAGNSVF